MGELSSRVVSDRFTFVVGVDTHSESHTYAILRGRNGEVCAISDFRADRQGIQAALAWIATVVSGETLLAIEGANSYGSLLAQVAAEAGFEVCDARVRMRDPTRPKNDQTDAVWAAYRLLGTRLESLARPRAWGARQMLSLLVMSRRDMEIRSVAVRNRLGAIVRTVDLGLDTTRKISRSTIRTLADHDWARADDPLTMLGRREVSRMANEYLLLLEQLDSNKSDLEAVVRSLAPGLLEIYGVGPVTAAVILGAYSHVGRVRSESAFASLAGVAPIEYASGKTTRHRLNRGGDRQLNRAIHTIVVVRLSREGRTREYVRRRTTEGVSKANAIRSLKRYVAREIFRQVDRMMRAGEAGKTTGSH
ncbi:transposase [Leifsonia sp. ZF2019]|uniref:transposase n=1 Tax=Leifsonia sp. ZF2019 TaxID=2781978 RepID=UPI001CC0E680|nr:transposase [Leifsonia sp. ZF2019]UAJ80142.1 transposase [Leifsonia sp. ZF2019]